MYKENNKKEGEKFLREKMYKYFKNNDIMYKLLNVKNI